MSKKNRLMAGVAMPVLSLSLLWQPALAAPLMPGGANAPAESRVIHVQEQPAAEQPIVPQEAAPEAAPEQPARQQQAQEEPAQQDAPAAERPRRERKSDAEPRAREASPESQRPRREAPAEQPSAEQPAAETPAEQPRQRPRGEDAPEGGRAREGSRDGAGDASQGERPRGERPARSSDGSGEARPDGERPRRDGEGRPRQQRGEQPAASQATPEQTAPDASNPNRTSEPGTAPTERPAAAPAQRSAPAQTRSAPAGTAPATTDQSGAAPVAPAAPGATPDASGTAPAASGAAPAAPSVPPATTGAATTAPAAGAPVASPRTPEEIERARAVAQDPSSASGTVVLPVENGAAVLDSAKEYPAPGAAPGQPRSAREGGARQQGGPAPAAAPAGPPPSSDAEAQAQAAGEQQRAPIRIEAATSERGERLDGRPRFEQPEGFEARGRDRDDGRVVLQFENRTIVRHDDSRRFYDDGYEPQYERLRGGRTREIIERDGGVQVITIRNRYGDVVQRSRIGDDGREYVLYYAPELMEERDGPRRWRDPGLDLPPMRLTVPLDDYIIDTSSEPDRDYYEFLEQPPVERVERVYSLDEVRYSARIRDKVRRIDLDTITFATGSAEIPMNQASSLRKVADAIKEVLERDPSETFLIEGHTDAVGADDSNLVLSDERAESVARVLTDAFDIAPENLATQGYGENYLKVRTDGPSQENRRVTIRRITPLVKPVAQAK